LGLRHQFCVHVFEKIGYKYVLFKCQETIQNKYFIDPDFFVDFFSIMTETIVPTRKKAYFNVRINGNFKICNIGGANKDDEIIKIAHNVDLIFFTYMAAVLSKDIFWNSKRNQCMAITDIFLRVFEKCYSRKFDNSKFWVWGHMENSNTHKMTPIVAF
jgi:hypothetical protein